MSRQGQGRGRLDKSPNVSRPQVINRTVSRDSTRCFYCKEPGRIARFCVTRQEEKNSLKGSATNMMANIDTEFENNAYENYEDIYDEQVEYLKQLEEFGASTPLTPFEARKIKYIPQHEKL